ncbi:hypothetical protein Syun_021866 [Stephania yunnanensis]|uniref:RING-type domain-containing protein n=1 Tax=Stephania yunnanensis TaxID=152371 RepID=A0AAP0IGE2_9MAGN
MGLHNNLSDVSSDSIPLLLVSILANCFNFMRTSLSGILHTMGLARLDPSMGDVQDGLIASGLAGLIVLAEQMRSYDDDDDGGDEVDVPRDWRCCSCVVCLCEMREGERVRKLGCRHVFHKECLDGWLFDHRNFTCPLCRSPLVSDERVEDVGRRVSRDLISWFSVR